MSVYDRNSLIEMQRAQRYEDDRRERQRKDNRANIDDHRLYGPNGRTLKDDTERLQRGNPTDPLNRTDEELYCAYRARTWGDHWDTNISGSPTESERAGYERYERNVIAPRRERERQEQEAREAALREEKHREAAKNLNACFPHNKIENIFQLSRVVYRDIAFNGSMTQFSYDKQRQVHWIECYSPAFSQEIFRNGLLLIKNEEEENQPDAHIRLYGLARETRFEESVGDQLLAFCSTYEKRRAMLVAFHNNELFRDDAPKWNMFRWVGIPLLEESSDLDTLYDVCLLFLLDRKQNPIKTHWVGHAREVIIKKMSHFLRSRKDAEEAEKKFKGLPQVVEIITKRWESMMLYNAGHKNIEEIKAEYGTLLTERVRKEYRARFHQLCCQNIADIIKFLSSTEDEREHVSSLREIARKELFSRLELGTFAGARTVHKHLMAYSVRLEELDKFYEAFKTLAKSEAEREEAILARRRYYEAHPCPPDDDL